LWRRKSQSPFELLNLMMFLMMNLWGDWMSLCLKMKMKE
jgi:hypothetical protein